MKKRLSILSIPVLVTTFLFSLAASAGPGGTLSDNIRIESLELGYSLQYRVYLPAGIKKGDHVPTIYLADGQWYLSEGEMKRILDEEIDAGRIKPVAAVFVDNRNPDNLKQNRRNDQFFCNPKYVSFFEKELLPTIDSIYPTSNNRDDRVIQGLSFGGYNAACFGLMAHESFAGISMHSPANSKMLKKIANRYSETEKLPINLFLSFGKKRDNGVEGRKFRDVLRKKGYNMVYREVNFGHEWKNWRPLIDDALQTFFAKK
jgi:enterochelin esterase-like enzyme